MNNKSPLNLILSISLSQHPLPIPPLFFFRAILLLAVVSYSIFEIIFGEDFPVYFSIYNSYLRESFTHGNCSRSVRRGKWNLCPSASTFFFFFFFCSFFQAIRPIRLEQISDFCDVWLTDGSHHPRTICRWKLPQ